MIEVHVVMKRFGIDHTAEKIAEMEIINLANHPKRPKFGNYEVIIDGSQFFVADHKRSDGVWKLIEKALKNRRLKT